MKNVIEPLNRGAGMIGIFHHLGCIGDSLSSGEFEFDDNGQKGFWDYYEYSWGSRIGAMAGISVTNFSRGGLTAKTLCEEADAGICTKDEVNHLFDGSILMQGYTIALGANDIKGPGYAAPMYSDGLGDPHTDICMEDPEKNRDSIIGWYAKIIQRLLAQRPEAKFFLIGLPNDDRREGREVYNTALQGICEVLPNCYYVDLYNLLPDYDAAFRAKYFDGHMTAMGYQLTAWYICAAIDRIIEDRWQEFRFVQFTGTDKRPFPGNSVQVENISEC